MNKYEARWNNALRIARIMQRLTERGYEFVDQDGRFVRSIEIRDTEIWYHVTDALHVLCLKHVHHHYGLEKTVDEFNAQFAKWKVLRPISIQTINAMERELKCNQ